MNNENLGLNPFLQPLNSPIVSYGKVVSSFMFDSTYDRNVISESKIAFLSADKIASGTVVVGLNLGSSSAGYLLLDGANNRILVNDGTTNRIVIGNV
jgi:hypothetical protein